MSEKIGVQKNCRNLEAIKWVLVSVLLIFAIVENGLYSDITYILRLLISIICVSVSIVIASFTIKGKAIIFFVRQAYTEVKKVVWPSRKEALRTTFIVVIVVAVMSLILWGLDAILISLVSFFINLRF